VALIVNCPVGKPPRGISNVLGVIVDSVLAVEFTSVSLVVGGFYKRVRSLNIKDI
jgi:hypothetical protein